MKGESYYEETKPLPQKRKEKKYENMEKNQRAVT